MTGKAYLSAFSAAGRGRLDEAPAPAQNKSKRCHNCEFAQNTQRLKKANELLAECGEEIEKLKKENAQLEKRLAEACRELPRNDKGEK